ncbi:hypothetical protein [Amycolatopsis sp. DG1A-15b]|uniref:hypothetical protein n=1 Tax=Amycolatopsis sp. DG1A-15b TaxID=3052846 RepID=UPI00255BEC07|nr:hypothetical protein [Amycolatopsis sp. DG1A-15b]WIX85512.1 hypothetical protein QRY02_30310 [Amycolatopsis sp. DG1A-15b]
MSTTTGRRELRELNQTTRLVDQHVGSPNAGLGRYTAPGRRIRFQMHTGQTGDGSPAPAVEVLRPAEKSAVVAARIRELHRALAALEPGRHEWRLLIGKVKPDIGAEMSLLRRAWDPDEPTLFAREIYEAILHMVEASYTTRQDILRRFNAAAQAAGAGKRGRAGSVSAQRWIPGTATPQEVMTAPLQVIDSEGAFLAHLRFLQEYSTLSTRTLHRELSKRVSRAPGHTTLVGWLKSAKLPAQLGEQVLRAMVEMLADDILGGEVGLVRQAADEHVRTYRMLVAGRQGEALLSGPVQRALAVLGEREQALDEADSDDRIRRELLDEMRERILAELAADREVALLASA